MRLLGPFLVRHQGVPLPPLRTRKGAWLLALLVLRRDRPLERTWLAGTLWPESGHRESLKSLRESLHDLRKALGSQAARLYSPTPSTLCLDLAEAEVDLLAFDAALARGSEALELVIQLYTGPLLEGCTEEWVLAERERREQGYLSALESLAERATARNQPTAAIRYLRLIIATDPLHEAAYAALMQALSVCGDYAAVTQVYRDLKLLLHRELHVTPSPKIEALNRHLQQQAKQAPFAPPSPSPSPPRRLPVPFSSLIGRQQEISTVIALLRQGRLITLVGTGGVGKTRLAIAVAEALAPTCADGVWFVALAALTDPDRVASTVAGTLGIQEPSGRSLEETLVEALASRSLLLILDNCEHLLEACAALAEVLLQECPNLRILATSRQALGLTGEAVYRVPCLALPEIKASPLDQDRLGILMESEAMQLFVERASQVEPSFVLTLHNAEAVAGICCELDGIPLAIELAASRLKALSAQEIRDRLGDRFGLLRGGSRTALARQQTLKAAIDWSYDLLSKAERVLLGRLSVFLGGWTLEAAETVCAETEAGKREKGKGKREEEAEVLDLLSSLVDKSLVLYEPQESGARYHLLETVRQYARERRVERAVEGRVRGRHRDYFLMLAETAEPKLTGAEQGHWLKVLDTEHDNLRQAIAFSLADPEGAEAGLRLGAALWRYWEVRGYFREGRAYLAEVLDREGASGLTQDRAKALQGAGALANGQGDYTAARVLYEESLAIKRELGDKPGIAQSFNSLGIVAHDQGDYGAARTLHEQSLAVRRELGDMRGISQSLNNLGNVAYGQGDYAAARVLYDESLAIRRELGDKRSISHSLNNLGNVAKNQGDYGAARALYEESLAIKQGLGDKPGIGRLLNNLGRVAEEQGDYGAARALYEESLEIMRELGDKQGIGRLLNNLGIVAKNQGDYAAARALYEESLAIKQELGDKPGIARSLGNLGPLACEEGHYREAYAFLAECLRLCQELGDRPDAVNALEGLALLATAQAQSERAARLWGAAVGLREAIGSPVPLPEWEEAFTAAWEEGRAMPLEEAIAFALGKPEG